MLMEYPGIIRQGIARANRNWPLIVVHVVAGIVQVFAAFVFIGIPVLIWLVRIGVDAAGMADLENLLQDGDRLLELLTEYMGMIAVIALGGLLYLVFALCFNAYIQAGTAGSVGRAATAGPLFRFGLGTFFSDARKYFWRVLLYDIFLGLLVLLALVFLTVTAVASGLLGSIAGGIGGGGGGFFGVFLQWMVIFTSGFLGFAGLMAFMGLALQGLAPLVMSNMGPVRSLEESLRLWKRDTRSLGLLALAVGGVLGAQMLLGVLGGLVQLMPLVGPLLYVPFRFAAGVFRIYLWLAALSAVFYYYALGNVAPPRIASASDTLPEGGASGTSASGSSSPGNISDQ